MIHGGEIYDKTIEYDFSVNLNPVPCPVSIKNALLEAVTVAHKYPDLEQKSFRRAVSDSLNKMTSADGISFDSDMIIGGNGASELISAVVQMVRPRKVLLPIPSFYGYVHALNMAKECEIITYKLDSDNDFELGKAFIDVIQEDIDLVIIGNPNNPTGRLIDREVLEGIIRKCRETNTALLVDECFYYLSGDSRSTEQKEDSAETSLSQTSISARNYISDYHGLFVIDAYTKLFSIPGVRVGYLVSCTDNITKIKRYLPEWNMSAFATAAGVACAMECTDDFCNESRQMISRERQFLVKELEKLGIKTYPSDSNFILIYSNVNLYDKLFEKKILIRDCSTYDGLCKGFYRIAVKNHVENMELVSRIKE